MDDPYLANASSEVGMMAYLLLEQAMCGCTDLCRCWWDEVALDRPIPSYPKDPPGDDDG